MATSSSSQCLSGQVCLVTGASRGIGKGTALQLGEAGATVYITGMELGRSYIVFRINVSNHFWAYVYMAVRMFLFLNQCYLQILVISNGYFF